MGHKADYDTLSRTQMAAVGTSGQGLDAARASQGECGPTLPDHPVAQEKPEINFHAKSSKF